MSHNTRDSSYSPRLLSLTAVCIQSTLLAVILHVSQARNRPGERSYKAASAVLLTEVGKLLLSLILALRDVWLERKALHAPRHALPSPELYSSGYEKKDKYSLPPDATAPESRRSTLRRRSSAISLDLRIENNDKVRRLSGRSALAAFQWPRTLLSPVPDMKESPMLGGSPDVVKMLNDPVLWTRRRRLGLRAMLWEDIFGSDWWKMGIPAVLFAVQNNLIYVAARNLSIPVFQITFQIKTVITAICAVVMLGRRLSFLQWVSLVTLGAGVASMQLGAIHAKSGGSPDHSPLVPREEDMNYFAGLTSVIVSCFASAIAATYFELVIKKPPVVPAIREYMMVAPPDLKPASLWVRNIQLSLFSTLFGACVVLFQASPTHFAFHGGLSLDFKGTLDPLEHWYDPFSMAADGFFEGFNRITWFVVGLQTIGGLLIALAIKHADNVAKGFALSISIVFTFLLSVILFDFQVTPSSLFGGMTVVASTLLFEVDQSALKAVFLGGGADRQKRTTPLLRRWHYVMLVVLGTCFLAGMVPMRRFSVTTAAWEAINSHMEQAFVQPNLPTIAIADMSRINAHLAKGATVEECGWGLKPLRASTLDPYGGMVSPSLGEQNLDFPYYEMKTGQYSLDDILAVRMKTYARNVPILASPSPDFIFLPLLSLFYSNPWGCQSEALHEGIRQTTTFIRSIVESVGKTSYPRIVLPITGIRSNLEDLLFTPEIMEEIKDSVIVVSIESAPKKHTEKLKYLIDVPYPTWFHLSSARDGAKPGVQDYFLLQKRPNLAFYAAAASHPWGAPATDPFNGFALRGVLHQQFSDYAALPVENQTSPVIFDDIKVALDGSQDLNDFHDHMMSSIFCPMPAGDSPTRRALYEAALLGCIPVIFRQRSYGRLLPNAPEINDMSKWTVYIDENEILEQNGPTLIERLEAITPREVTRMQHHIASIASKLQWSITDHDFYFNSDPANVMEYRSRNEIRPGHYNHTRSVEDQFRLPPTTDAFSMLLKELEAIRDGTWRAGIAKDLRSSKKQTKPFGKPPAQHHGSQHVRRAEEP